MTRRRGRRGLPRHGRRGRAGRTKAPTFRWSSSSESESSSQTRPCRGGSGHWTSTSFNSFIRRRSGRWKDFFAATDRSLLRIDGAIETGMLHGRGGAAVMEPVVGGWGVGVGREPTARGPAAASLMGSGETRVAGIT
jgi:hypothetical protein